MYQSSALEAQPDQTAHPLNNQLIPKLTESSVKIKQCHGDPYASVLL